VVASIPGGVATAPAAGVDRRQEGGKGGSVALEEEHGQGRERKGARHRAAAFICAAGGRGRRVSSGVATAWKRETGGEGGQRRGRRPAPTHGRQPWAGGTHAQCGAEQGRPGGDEWAPPTVPGGSKFTSKSYSNRFKLFKF
jgi:hypothetical protein